MKATKAALKWIAYLLERHRIDFRISGGFAAKTYGSKRPLADIDIELKTVDMIRIFPYIRSKIIFGPRIYEDKNWRLFLITIRFKGQEIDLCGKEVLEIFDKNRNKWVRIGQRASRREFEKVYGIEVPVIGKKELIDYKSKLMRRVDRQDLKYLTGNR